jgi:hypothetical protein
MINFFIDKQVLEVSKMDVYPTTKSSYQKKVLLKKY